MSMIFDGHLDIAFNALGYDRDQTAELESVRQRERPFHDAVARGAGVQTHRGLATVTLPQMLRGGVAAFVGTLLARSGTVRPLDHEPPRYQIDHAHPFIAEAVALGQLAYYQRLERAGWIEMVTTGPALASAWKRRVDGGEARPIPFVLTMEGCDPIVDVDDLRPWWDRGLRTACLAHYGQGRYCFGTGGDGPLTDAGQRLVDAMDDLGMILDLVHTADQALEQALARFDGPVYVSHANCRALVPGDRQLSDDQIRQLAKRGAVIGVVCDRWMLDPNFDPANPDAPPTPLSALADHLDHICQVTGSDQHAAIGSDLDGGFGAEQCPHELSSIADLARLAPILRDRGYAPQSIDAVFHANWRRFFTEHLPEE